MLIVILFSRIKFLLHFIIFYLYSIFRKLCISYSVLEKFFSACQKRYQSVLFSRATRVRYNRKAKQNVFFLGSQLAS